MLFFCSKVMNSRLKTCQIWNIIKVDLACPYQTDLYFQWPIFCDKITQMIVFLYIYNNDKIPNPNTNPKNIYLILAISLLYLQNFLYRFLLEH